MSKKYTGSVVWFNNSKGYGFIHVSDGLNVNDNVFVHYSNIKTDGYKGLQSSQRVSFEIKETPKGLEALNVTLI